MLKAWSKYAGGFKPVWFISVLLSLAVLLSGCGATIDELLNVSGQPQHSSGASEQKEEPLTSFKGVSDYIRKHEKLPPNFIKKKEAEELGWVPSEGNLDKVAPGKSIGGDRFGNREGLLPKAKNRNWYEADIHYKGGRRGADRILYSSDGLIFMTRDHYKSFTDITKEGSVPHD
ncbi:ribonuclease domain-containing protein [Paenibacillus paeoniae]|uniref:Ribonuclease n=1 Tax=Paenibacillus paeoniae TaxID=2292705 RepID=A0A371PM40_9BACL|nr:ribonuclease domain-containing protein [Paenibacillus paeoniae]REK76709.1 hypothetical protein DX130_06630 [Paenibacillus paeoniae]